ncbi:MAG: LanC-like protein [Burkholderiales bacterium]|nr:LanC-like protein [Burkholderiales bacterium]
MMTGLFDPTRHEPLQAPPWDEAAALAAIRRIADAALAACEPGLGWRAHPLDDPEPPIDRFHNLYFGSGGVIWALRHLAQGGAIEALPDFTPFVATLREANRPLLADSHHGSASYLFGDAGLDLLHWALQPDEAVARRLFDTVRGNLHNPARETLWGNPGTVLAAIHMAEATGEARWAALVREAADALQAEMEVDADTGTWLWVQNLYGRPPVRYIGAGHGFAGNVYPFLRAAALLPTEQVALLAERALATLQATAQLADGGANWFPGINPQRPAHWLPSVQDCHGAPGIVCRLAAAPRTPAWDTLLLQAGALTWHAGPLSKGASLCHGTAGSGFAMLKLWRRSGQPVWLVRARALAMHGCGQVERHRVEHGQGRHSLWTGDLGLACLLWNCVAGSDALPTLDVF